MTALVEQHSARIHELCERFQVRQLELFGSAARPEFDPATSDMDFLVAFQNDGWQGSFKRYMGLKLGLEDLFGRAVDLVELNEAGCSNPYFMRHIAQDRRLIYAA